MLVATHERSLTHMRLEDGQLGQGNFEGSIQPNFVESIKARKCTEIAAGWQTSASITTHGVVLVWGGNGRGQLGMGDRESRLTPTPVPLTDGLFRKRYTTQTTRGASVSMGHYHTLILTDEHRVYSFGGNDNGQLGHGGLVDELEPKPEGARVGERGDDETPR